MKTTDQNQHEEILKDVYDSYPFNQLTKWGWFKLWLTADVPYFFMSLWWKITKKY